MIGARFGFQSINWLKSTWFDCYSDSNAHTEMSFYSLFKRYFFNLQPINQISDSLIMTSGVDARMNSTFFSKIW